MTKCQNECRNKEVLEYRLEPFTGIAIYTWTIAQKGTHLKHLTKFLSCFLGYLE